MAEFQMPKMDHLSEEATVSAWLKKEGEMVSKGEVILQAETGKTILDVESPLSGTLKKILVAEGETVPVHTAIAIIE